MENATSQMQEIFSNLTGLFYEHGFEFQTPASPPYSKSNEISKV
jgi:hypothetical protein